MKKWKKKRKCHKWEKVEQRKKERRQKKRKRKEKEKEKEKPDTAINSENKTTNFTRIECTWDNLICSFWEWRWIAHLFSNKNFLRKRFLIKNKKKNFPFFELLSTTTKQNFDQKKRKQKKKINKNLIIFSKRGFTKNFRNIRVR